MAKVDMHVHSSYSERPSEWFLQRLGTRESYTDPEAIYREALRQGMDFVTITDHNTIEGALLLKERYPERVFTGLEATTYFPDTGCKVHLLIYGLDQTQFRVIDRLRPDIYRLRDYVREQGLPHSVAHATYSINNRLTLRQIEKLLVLFDSFEAINGSRSRYANEVLQQALAALTPERMQKLARTCGIEPFGATPWRKALTGGTDDHGGLFIGRTYTEAEAHSPEAFLQALARKETSAGGRHNDYRGLAFSLYKIAWDFSRSNDLGLSSPLLSALNTLLFDHNALTVKNRFTLRRVSWLRSSGTAEALVADLIDTLKQNRGCPPDDLLTCVHDTVAQLCDEIFKRLASTIEASIAEGNIARLVQSVSGALPGLFLSLPFFTSLNILYESRDLLDALQAEYTGSRSKKRAKKILMLTDAPGGRGSADDFFERYARMRGYGAVQGFIADCCATQENTDPLSLPSVYSFELPFGSRCTLNVPSLLNALQYINEQHPDEIVAASPGPMGLLGLLAAKLLHIPCVAIRDRRMATAAGTGDDAALGDRYFRWFYSMTDCVVEGFAGAGQLNPFLRAPDMTDDMCRALPPLHAAVDPAAMHPAQAL